MWVLLALLVMRITRSTSAALDMSILSNQCAKHSNIRALICLASEDRLYCTGMLNYNKDIEKIVFG